MRHIKTISAFLMSLLIVGQRCRWVLGFLVIWAGHSRCPAMDVISPVESNDWKDSQSHSIQAHGGSVIKHNGVYYWFGTDLSAGIPSDTRCVSCYSSVDLVHWTFKDRVLEMKMPVGYDSSWVLERPRVYVSKDKSQFVMYMHLDYGNYKAAEVGVAVSSSIAGKYNFLQKFRPLGNESRDIGQFVDEDHNGRSYLISEDRAHGGFHLYELSDDRKSVLSPEIALVHQSLEGGSIVFMKDKYYFVGSHLTSWDPNPNVYLTASSLADLAHADPVVLAPPEMNNYGSQSSCLLKVVGSQATSVIFIGDIWKERMPGSSRYFWMPLEIGTGTMSLPEPQDWSIDVSTGKITFIGKKYAYINWLTPDSIAPKVELTANRLNAIASVPGTLSYNKGVNDTLEAVPEFQTLTATLVPNDTVHYQGTQKSVDIQVTTLPKITSDTTALIYERLSGTSPALSKSVVISGVPEGTLSGATVMISETNPPNADDEKLIFNPVGDIGGIKSTWYPWTGALVLEGVGTVMQYQNALQGICYINNSLNPTFVSRKISMRVNSTGRIWSDWNAKYINIVSKPYFLDISFVPNRLVALGGKATFTAVANGGPAVSYQWKKNNQAIPGANQSTYVTSVVTMADDNSDYTCEITNSRGRDIRTYHLMVVPNGLVAQWRYHSDSATAGSLTEEVCASRNAAWDDGRTNGVTLRNTTWVDGRGGYALNFDGMSSLATVEKPALPLVDQVTVALWAYDASNGPRPSVLLTAMDASNNRVLNLHVPWSDGNVYWDAGSNSPQLFDRIQWAGPVSRGQWHHWVFSKNAATGTMSMYMDGRLCFSDSGKTRALSPITYLTMGGSPDNNGSQFYSGRLDDVRIYNKELSKEDVQDLYMGSYMVARWNCDASSGATLADSVGGNDCTVVNPIWDQSLGGRALKFDGKSTIATVSSPKLRLKDQIAISLWSFDASTETRASTLLTAVDASGNRVFNLHVPWSDGKVYWDAGGDSAGFDRLSWSGDVNRGQWHHWVFTKNVVNGTMAIYLDGRLCSSGVTRNKTFSAISYLTIGGSPAMGGSQLYSGLLDDVRIYNRELSDTDVQDLYLNSYLVSRWTCNASSGTTLVDSVGSNHCTVLNPNWVPGRDGNALSLDGTSSFASIASPNLKVTDQVTVALWAYDTSTGPRSSTLLAALDASGNRVMNLHVPWGDGNVYWDAGNNGQDYDRLSCVAPIGREQWHHWVFTKNSVSGGMAIYRDGILCKSMTSGMNKAFSPISYLSIGASPSLGGSQYYAGRLDDVRIYNRELSPDHIRDLFLRSCLVAHWKCDADSGSLLPDSVGCNHCAVTNPTWVPGRDGNALALDGKASIAGNIGVPALNITDQIAIALWIYDDSTAPRQSTLLTALDAANNRVLNLHVPWDDGKVYWDAGNNGLLFDRMIWPGGTDRGQWHHWVFTKNAVNGTMAIYRDGRMCSSVQGMARMFPAISLLRIGGGPAVGGSQFYAGRLDDIRIYNHELTLEEVLAIFTRYTPRGNG